tara:strand:- start:221 stop:547 length:327 start_codon:yes stop_codon:yes gene_type:complete
MKTITDKELQQIRNTLALLNSMIRGGENHSERSTGNLIDTFNLVDNLPIGFVSQRSELLKIIKMTNKERFMQLVSKEKTNTIKINKRRIKYRFFIRLKNKLLIWWYNF